MCEIFNLNILFVFQTTWTTLKCLKSKSFLYYGGPLCKPPLESGPMLWTMKRTCYIPSKKDNNWLKYLGLLSDDTSALFSV